METILNEPNTYQVLQYIIIQVWRRSKEME